MRTVLLALAVALVILLVLLVAVLLIGLGVLGVGWLFARIFPLSQYEATIVALATGAMLVLLLARILEAAQYMERQEYDDEDEEEGHTSPYRQMSRLGRRRVGRR